MPTVRTFHSLVGAFLHGARDCKEEPELENNHYAFTKYKTIYV